MNHRVQSVQDLYEDAVALFKRGVMGTEDHSADTIISNLGTAINVLKGCWEGSDAGVQINNIVTVFNGMIDIRNALVSLASDSSKIASNYREIQKSNGAQLDTLTPLVAEERTKLPAYSDTRDTINITPQANEGKAKVDAANGAMDAFISNVKMYYEKIMQNWTAGTNRDKAQNAFNAFVSKSNSYKELLNNVSTSIANAVKNYNF